jgi:hypothetical protein
MLSREEAIFVDNLFNAINYLGIEMLPTNITSPKGAVSKLKDYIEKEMPQDYEKIRTIFVKESLSGDYARFRAGVAELEKVCVENSFSRIMQIKKRTDDPEEKYIGLAKRLCEFAERD